LDDVVDVGNRPVVDVVAVEGVADPLDVEEVELEVAVDWLEDVELLVVFVAVDFVPVVAAAPVLETACALGFTLAAMTPAAVRCVCGTADRVSTDRDATSLWRTGLLLCWAATPATTPPPAIATAATAAATRPSAAAGEVGPASWVAVWEAVCSEVNECERDVLEESPPLP
jgi:hypothetical protein